MKYTLLTLVSWFFAAFSFKAMAQEDKKDKKSETEEIVIRKKGDKDVNLTIQITGDKVMVNGKPIVEFNEDGITVNKRKIIVKDGNNFIIDGMNMGEFPFAQATAPVSRTFLGVTTEETEDGAKIKSVTEGSAAAKAGLQEDDIITKFGDAKIKSPQDLYDAVTKKKANDEVKISYKRKGKEKSVKATLQERKESVRSFAMRTPKGSGTFVVPRTPREPGMKYLEDLEKLGDLRNMDFNFDFPHRPKLGLKIQDTENGTGVKVMSVDSASAAEKAGLRVDDVVTEIAGEKITNTDEAREALRESQEKSAYVIKAKRGNSEMSFDIKIPKKLKTANL